VVGKGREIDGWSDGWTGAVDLAIGEEGCVNWNWTGIVGRLRQWEGNKQRTMGVENGLIAAAGGWDELPNGVGGPGTIPYNHTSLATTDSGPLDRKRGC